MITNLLVTIVFTLITNVTERWPTHQVFDGNGFPDHPEYLTAVFKTVPDANPTNKWVRTTITQDKVANGSINDTNFSVVMEHKVVSDIEVEYAVKRTEAWNPVGTNDVSDTYLLGNEQVKHYHYNATNMGTFTNGVIMGCLMVTNNVFISLTNTFK